jgi:hypothetical protein
MPGVRAIREPWVKFSPVPSGQKGNRLGWPEAAIKATEWPYERRIARADKTARAFHPIEPLSSGRRLDGRDQIRAARRLESETVAHGYQQKCQSEHGLFVGLLVRCSERMGLNRWLDWFVPVSSYYRLSAKASERAAPSGMNCSISIPSALATPIP